MRAFILTLPMLFIGMSIAQAEKKQNVLIIPLMDSNFQVTRLEYESETQQRIAGAIVGGLLGGVTGGALGEAIYQSGRPPINQMTHYRSYDANIDLNKIVINKLKKDLNRDKKINVFGLLDTDQQIQSIKKSLFEKNLYGINRKKKNATDYLDILNGSDFDIVFFVSNENTIFKYGNHKFLPLHGYGIFYDMKRLGLTISYFGASIVAYRIKDKLELGSTRFSGKVKTKAPNQKSEELRRVRITRFLETEYGKPINELPQYNFFMTEMNHRKNVKKILRQFSADFENSDGDIDKNKYKKLRTLVYHYAHHQFGDYNNLPELTKRAMINQSVKLFEKVDIDLDSFIDLEDNDGSEI